MENYYNQYTTFVRQSVTNLNNQQLSAELKPYFETLKQKVRNNQYTLDNYQGVKNQILQEIENNISNSYSLSSFNSKLDSAISDLNSVSNSVKSLLQQPTLSQSLKNSITSFQNDCYRNLNLSNTQNAVYQINEYRKKFDREELDRKEKQKKLTMQILKWSGIALGVGVIIWIITSYWQIILGIIVLAAIGGIISFFSKD